MGALFGLEIAVGWVTTWGLVGTAVGRRWDGASGLTSGSTTRGRAGGSDNDGRGTEGGSTISMALMGVGMGEPAVMVGVGSAVGVLTISGSSTAAGSATETSAIAAFTSYGR